MEATPGILQDAGAKLQLEEIEIGQSVYPRSVSAGIEPSARESLRRTHVERSDNAVGVVP